MNAGKSQADIARLINRSRSTISREIKRGTVQQRNSDYLFFTKYFADTSQLIHDKARHAVSENWKILQNARNSA